jgi:hypothetical protein
MCRWLPVNNTRRLYCDDSTLFVPRRRLYYSSPLGEIAARPRESKASECNTLRVVSRRRWLTRWRVFVQKEKVRPSVSPGVAE